MHVGPALTPLEHPTPAERAAAGKAVRRKAHGDWGPAADRRDAVDALEEQARSRVPELVPIRYGRMLLSPLAFFRGAAAVMASDLAHAPRTGLEVQLSGDAHLLNFGVYAAPDRRRVFSLNDFDKALSGPFEWDAKRLAASFAVAGRERNFDRRERRSITLAAAPSYRLALRAFAEMRNLDVWFARLELDQIVEQLSREVKAKHLDSIERNLAKRRAKDHLRAFAKLTVVEDGETAHRQRPAADRSDRGAPAARRVGTAGRCTARDLRVIPEDARRRSPPATRQVPVCARRAKSGGDRQRRRSGLDANVEAMDAKAMTL
jgi:hypothetical protein